MLFKVAMIILLIVIIFLVIKYLYVQAKILSSREFRKTAEKKSAVMQVYDPQITCDYCGYIINTAKDSKCPNCGAVYGGDKELKKRYRVDAAAVEKMADDAAKDAVSRAHKKGLETLRHIRIAILALAGVFVLMIVFSLIADRIAPSGAYRYRSNEKVKDYDYKDYKLISSPELTILDRDDVEVRLMSIYADTDNGKYNNQSYSYRVGFSLINKRPDPVHFCLKCVGINGRSKSRDYIYLYSYFEGKSQVLFYESVYGEWFDSIDEMVFGEISISDDNGKIYEDKTMKVFKISDDGYTAITDDNDKGSVVFENDKVRIRSLIKEKRDRGYDLWIENRSKNDYYINTSYMKVGGTAYNSYILYDSGLPAGYTLHHDSVFVPGEEFEKRADDAVVAMSFSFSDPVDPTNDFSTGYIELK